MKTLPKLKIKLNTFLRSRLFQTQIRLLRLEKAELEKFIRETAAANPFLEWERQKGFSSSSGKENQRATTEPASPADTLKQKVLMGLYAGIEGGHERNIAEFIISSLNSKGFLEASPAEIAKTLKKEEREIKKVWEKIKIFFGDGTAAANTQEALAIQARAKGWELEEKIILRAYSDLQRLQIDKIAKKIRTSKARALKAVKNIRKLSPFPGIKWESSPAVTPEFRLVKKDDEFSIHNPSPWRLALNTEYLQALSRKSSRLLKEKLRQAKILAEAVDRREEILRKITDFLIRKQKKYLLGEGKMQDITLDDISRKLKIDKTTASRALRNKYIEYQGRLFKLSRLVVHKKQKGKSYSQALQIIKESVGGEDKSRPLSDKALQDILQREGIRLQRRLVTKYRLHLGIPSSFMRKRIAMLDKS